MSSAWFSEPSSRHLHLSTSDLEQRPHSLLTNCPCTDWADKTHTHATNTIERSNQTYASLFQATALRPLCNTAKDALTFVQTL